MKLKVLSTIFIFVLSILGCAPASTPTATAVPPTSIPKPTATVTPDPNAWNLVWADEFDQPNGSAPDSTKWNHQQGGSGWGNGELQHYTDSVENAFIENGMLVIKANKEYMLGRDYTSARLTTQFKGDWTNGRFEIRARLPNTQGIWPAFWLLPSRGRYGSGPAGGEIDIMEMIGSEPYRSYGTVHFGNPAEHSSDSYDLPNGKTYADDFHIFSLEWEPNEIRWYVDGKLVHKTVNGVPHTPHYLILNTAVGGGWPGNPDSTTTFPQYHDIDYVRIYQRQK